jgi:proteasome lid subunit RPN8/RPN11
MTNALNISTEASKAAAQDCLGRIPEEACGFIVGPRNTYSGVRVVPMRNVHPAPEKNYDMDPQEILKTYATFDEHGEDVVAVYHSHIESQPILSSGRSDTDVEKAQDLGVAYMVIGIIEGQPRARAYRIRQPYVGVREPIEVPLNVTPSGDPWAPDIPLLPWALTPGQEVKIRYVSHHSGQAGQIGQRTEKWVTATVIALDVEHADTVILEPKLKGGIRRLPLDRIQDVIVLREVMEGHELRRAVIRCARHVIAACASGEDLSGVQDLIQVMAAAFPPGIEAIPKES